MEQKKEHFIIKIKMKDGGDLYWKESLKNQSNTTVNPSSAKKYSDFNEAKAKAIQISEQNNLMTLVVKVETIVKTNEIECIVPEKMEHTKDAFWEYMETVDKYSDAFREMMNIGHDYFNAGKNPDEYLNEIIDKAKKKLNMK